MITTCNAILQPLPGLHVLPLDMNDQSKGVENKHQHKRDEEDGRTLAELDGLPVVLGGGPVEQDMLELLVEQHGWMVGLFCG